MTLRLTAAALAAAIALPLLAFSHEPAMANFKTQCEDAGGSWLYNKKLETWACYKPAARLTPINNSKKVGG